MAKFPFTSMVPIIKGQSEDRKWKAIGRDGKKYLFRISPAKEYSSKSLLFSMLQQASALGIPLCQPVDLGVCREGVYTLYTWIEGEDASAILPNLSDKQQYALGITAGETLRKLHSLSHPSSSPVISGKRERRIDKLIAAEVQRYWECPLHLPGDRFLISFLEDCGSSEDWKRPSTFRHGDYHPGNMLVENGRLVILDFDCYDFGDPWEEFRQIVQSVKISPTFASGQLNGYFGNRPPEEFFRAMAFFLAANTLSSIPWAVSLGQKEVDAAAQMWQDVLKWYDNMNTVVPAWYRSSLNL